MVVFKSRRVVSVVKQSALATGMFFVHAIAKMEYSNRPRNTRRFNRGNRFGVKHHGVRTQVSGPVDVVASTYIG